MAKILITSIGSGRYDKETREKKYIKAKYYAGENRNDFHETAYIFSALRRFRGIDRCIFVGTCGSNWHLFYGSNWHLFYESLYNPNSGVMVKPATPYEEAYSFSLLQFFEQENKSQEDVGKFQNMLQPLKKALSELNAEIIVLKYGLNPEENLWNFATLTSIGEYVKDGDCLCFDITHSFRSLAFYELLAVSYFKDVLKKKISIDFVSYGMLEYRDENGGLTPIVDLSILVHAMDWIKAAEEYNRFGTAKLLAELFTNRRGIGVDVTNAEINALNHLGSTAIATNGFADFKTLISNCRTIVDSGQAENNVVLGHIFRDLARRFSGIINNNALLYTELSKWHIDKGRYMESAICLVECILDYGACLCGIRRNKAKGEKEEIRIRFRKVTSINNEVKNFIQQFHLTRKFRNDLCHAVEIKKEDWKKLKKYVKYFANAFKNHFTNNSIFEEELRDALLAVQM